jgi:hypothetical protein
MIESIVSALLPIVVTLLLEYIATWHEDFDARHASSNRKLRSMLALALFAGMLSILFVSLRLRT